MDDNIFEPDVAKAPQPIIKVIGVGGGGGNAVTNMYKEGIHNVSFVLCNTDKQALDISEVPAKLLLGRSTTNGLGSGNVPEVGEKAALESEEEIHQMLSDGTRMSLQAPAVVSKISREWLGTFGSVLAILGVVAAPITSGDTAFRSARLIIADFFHLNQHRIISRLYIAVPLFLTAIVLLYYNINDKNGFNVIWRYFGWANQSLATFTLWAVTVYLTTHKKLYWVSLIPALFMTAVCTAYIFVAPEGLKFPVTISQIIGVCFAVAAFIFFWVWKIKRIDPAPCVVDED